MIRSYRSGVILMLASASSCAQEAQHKPVPDDVDIAAFALRDNRCTSQELPVLARLGPKVLPELEKRPHLPRVKELTDHARSLKLRDVQRAMKAVAYFSKLEADLFACEAMTHRSLAVRVMAQRWLDSHAGKQAIGMLIVAYDHAKRMSLLLGGGETIVSERWRRARILSLLARLIGGTAYQFRTTVSDEGVFLDECRDWWKTNNDGVMESFRRATLPSLRSAGGAGKVDSGDSGASRGMWGLQCGDTHTYWDIDSRPDGLPHAKASSTARTTVRKTSPDHPPQMPLSRSVP